MAVAATLQVLIWPRRPQAPPPPASLTGWNPLGERPGNAKRATSLSVSRRFGPADLVKPAMPLELTLTSLAQTSDEGIEVAALTKGEPLLALRDRRLLRLGPDDRPSNPKAAVAAGVQPARSQALRQVAIGRIDGQSALQTCLTPVGYAVTASGTQNLLFKKAITLQQRWNYLLRRWPPQPHTCLLVTLRGPLTADELLQVWPAVHLMLKPNLQSPS